MGAAGGLLQTFRYTGAILSTALIGLVLGPSATSGDLHTLDVRQHSEVHERVVGEILAQAGVLAPGKTYAELTEAQKERLLTRELCGPRPLLPREWEGSDDQDKDKAGLKGTEQMGRSSRHHRPLRHKKHFRVMELTAAKFATVL